MKVLIAEQAQRIGNEMMQAHEHGKLPGLRSEGRYLIAAIGNHGRDEVLPLLAGMSQPVEVKEINKYGTLQRPFPLTPGFSLKSLKT